MKIKRNKAQDKKPVKTQVEAGFADAFEAVLAEQEVHFTTEVNDRGDAIFRIPYRTEAGRRVTVLLQFDRAENVIRFYAFGYIQNTPPEREAAILEKLNDVNRRMLFYKFYLDDDRDIVLCWYFPYLTKDQLFSAGGLNVYILRALDVLDKLHGEFMEAVDGENEAQGMRADAAERLETDAADALDAPDAQADGRATGAADLSDAAGFPDSGSASDPFPAREGDGDESAAWAAEDAPSGEGAKIGTMPAEPADGEAACKEPPRLYVVKPRDPEG